MRLKESPFSGSIEDEFSLSYDDIKLEEGVYEPKGVGNIRLVVIRAGSTSNASVIFVSKVSVQPAEAGAWSRDKFRKTNETFSVKIQ